MNSHWSDCAVYNEPAMPSRECDCGGLELSVDDAHAAVVLRISLPGALGDFLRNMHRESLVERHHFPADRLSADAAAAYLKDAHARVSGRRDADRMYLDDAGKSVVSKFEASAGIQGEDG